MTEIKVLHVEKLMKRLNAAEGKLWEYVPGARGTGRPRSWRRKVLENAEPDAAPHAVHCQVCDRKLMGLSYPVVYRPKTLDNLNLVHSSEEGAWCSYCRRVTVFVRDPGA